VFSSRRGSRDIEHIGSAHDVAELEALKTAVRQRLAGGQGELDLGLDAPGLGRLEITSSRMEHVWDDCTSSLGTSSVARWRSSAVP
jgi:hypothetical protein